MNTIAAQTTSQYPSQKKDFLPLSNLFWDDAVSYFSNNLNETERRLLFTLINQCSRYIQVYTSQDTLGEISDRTREHVNRCLKSLEWKGFIKKTYRGVKKTCVYEVNPLLGTKQITWALRTIFPIIKAFFVSDLLSSPSRKEEVTQHNIYTLLVQNYLAEQDRYVPPHEKWAEREWSMWQKDQMSMQTNGRIASS